MSSQGKQQIYYYSTIMIFKAAQRLHHYFLSPVTIDKIIVALARKTTHGFANPFLYGQNDRLDVTVKYSQFPIKFVLYSEIIKVQNKSTGDLISSPESAGIIGNIGQLGPNLSRC
jgi:hypothetical protein